MDDINCKVQVNRGRDGKVSVVVSMLQPDGTFYRESLPLDKDNDIKTVVETAFQNAKKAHQNHLTVTTNPTGVEMEPDGVE